MSLRSLRTLAAAVTLTLALGGVAVPLTTASPARADDGSLAQPPRQHVVSQAAGWDRALPPGTYRQVAYGDSVAYGITGTGRVVGRSAAEGAEVPASLHEVDVTQLSAGSAHGLALAADGSLTTWGWVDEERKSKASIPPQLQGETFRQIASAADHDLGLTADGRVLGWGITTYGNELAIPTELEQPGNPDPVVKIVTGFGLSAALTASGRLHVWGYHASGIPDEFEDEDVVDISAGLGHVVALTADGAVHDLGFLSAGEPPAALADETVVAIAAGEGQTGVITADGDVLVWGEAEPALPTLRTDARPTSLHLHRFATAVLYRAMSAASAPTLPDESPRFGLPIAVQDGPWSEEPDSVTYRWEVDGEAREESSSSYTPTAQDLDGRLAVTVSAHKDGYVDAVTRVEHELPVAPARFTSAPQVTLTGTPQVGRQLVGAVTTDASPLADSYRYQWAWRSEGFEDVILGGAEGLTRVASPFDEGSYLALIVTAEREGYEPVSTAAVTPVPVAPGRFEPGPRVAAIGSPRVGKTLTAATSGFEPAAQLILHQWRRNGAPIPGATGGTYRPVARDLGAVLTVLATVTRTGFEPAGATSAGVRIGLPSADLGLVAPTKAARRKRIVVKLSRLGVGEAWTLRLAGKVVARGRASARGTAVVRLRAPRATGRRVLTLVGSYADRTATRAVTVVRR